VTGSASDPHIGRTLGARYRIDGRIARGGMARVYRARDTRLDRDVAVKILSSPYADDPAFTQRFLAEARAAASITHPSLVHVYDSGSDGDAHFIVMELLDRHRSLREELRARSRLPWPEVLRMGRELLAGLAVVHERGLVHCDVKAGNVMLGPGPAKLIDFGIARTPEEATDGDTSIGSLHSMSPEQLRGEQLTPASDLFALGVALYEALTGRVPYPGETPDEVAAAHRRGEVRPPSSIVESIPARLDTAILQALRHEPRQRFHSAEAMARALGTADEEPQEDVRDDATRVVRVPPSRPEPDDRAGYVPPSAAREAPAPNRSAPRASASPRRAAPPLPPPRRRARRNWAGLLGTLLILATVGFVVVFVVLPLMGLGGGAGGGSPTPSASSPPSAAPGRVTVPDTVGMATDDAIAAATEAGLDWTVFCNEDPSRPEGIVDQEPPAGTTVTPGSTFSMYSARISDCP
jgi:eukaryotic-like serine/threonine-protein kinase